jgi:hypothetical protein
MNNPAKFYEMMINFDKDNQSESSVKKVNTILNNPEYSAEKAKNASVALSGIY